MVALWSQSLPKYYRIHGIHVLHIPYILSSNLVTVLSPIFAASLFALYGFKLILTIDLLSFAVAFLVLLLIIKIPEDMDQKEEKNLCLLDVHRGSAI